MLTDRQSLFRLQGLIALGSVVLMVFIVYAPPESWLKVLIAPFGSLSLMLFVLFVINKIIKNFHSDPYSVLEISISIVVLCLMLISMHYLISILAVNRTLDKVIFYSSIFIGFLIFIYLRVGNIWSMAIMTGIAEGIITYIIFYN